MESHRRDGHITIITLEFQLGTPFKPYQQQLMGALPVVRMDHIPLAYQDLMYGPNSPIIDFHSLESNGKK